MSARPGGVPDPSIRSVPRSPTSSDTDRPITVVWFRQDLRIADNPALSAAVAAGGPVIPLYVLDDETPGQWRPGGASRWWLERSLAALGADLARLGSPLVLRRGRADQVVPAFMAETGARAIHWNRCYEPYAVARDTHLKERLRQEGHDVASHAGSLLREPREVKGKAGTPLKVFTPFWRAVQALGDPPAPLPAPKRLVAPAKAPRSDALADWALYPGRPDWAAAFPDHWTPGEAGAKARFATFSDEAMAGYAARRDLPGVPGTSRLSPHLRWGEISPRTLWHATAHLGGKGAEHFLREVGWREFSYHLLHHEPGLPERNLRPEFDAFPWARAPKALARWQRGETGYPIVDAGMRELWATGWMHNRVRMITASFLIKDLLIDWREGEDWFWDTLVDADLASNAASWQWVAGCGADAAPYFRVFNPSLQGAKFDPDGAYVRRWIPELARLPDSLIHTPWLAPALVLEAGGVRLGRDYPEPMVDHGMARDRALAAFETIKKKAAAQ
jgi:deoxyribodipyrimidine photo-lyase